MKAVGGLMLDKIGHHKFFLKVIPPVILLCNVALIYVSKCYQTLYTFDRVITLFLVRNDAYAAIQNVMVMGQFFMSFLVPVAIELGSESKQLKSNPSYYEFNDNALSYISGSRRNIELHSLARWSALWLHHYYLYG